MDGCWIVTTLERHRVGFAVDGEQLLIEAPPGVLTDYDWRFLREEKAGILAYLEARRQERASRRRQGTSPTPNRPSDEDLEIEAREYLRGHPDADRQAVIRFLGSPETRSAAVVDHLIEYDQFFGRLRSPEPMQARSIGSSVRTRSAGA